MKKHRILILMALCGILPAMLWASDRDDDIARVQKAADVFREVVNTPDKGIPDHLLSSAKCIAIIPGDKKFAFVFGGNYGRGVASCRADHGWSARSSSPSKAAAWVIKSADLPPISFFSS